MRLVGGPDCAEAVATCSVYVNDELGGTRVVTNTGADERVTESPENVTDVDTEAGLLSVNRPTDANLEPGSCSTLTDRQYGEELQQICDYTYGSISPGGRYLSATHGYQDGFGDGWHAILDARTGKELARYEGEGGITRSVWEDDDHLLVTSWEDGKWRVTRLGADGSTEVVLGPEKGKDYEPTYAVLGEAF